MPIKNSKKIFFSLLISLFTINANLYADEFDIKAKEINIDKENEILVAVGSVEAKDADGKIVLADKITYKKNKEFLLAEGNVIITDTEGNTLITNKATYDKINEIITTYELTKLNMQDGYNLSSQNISYHTEKQIISSNNSSLFKDSDGNIIETSMFQYQVKNNLFSSVGKVKIVDINKNKYFFKEIHIDTKKKEMVGSNISVILDQETFGVSNESDPRFVGNDIFLTKNKTILSKGVFTVCKLEKDKCPPWTLKAKKITHDKVKKTIYYDSAILKVYDVPIFYFPKFFHPDPTVKRQSGFLAPYFTSSSILGTGSATPYYWAISNSRDLTFTPKIYNNENALYLNEYRQAFSNGFLTLDTSYTEGYKNTSSLKTPGSRGHIFGNLDLKLNKDETFNSDFQIKFEQTTHNNYLKDHGIDTILVDPENTLLENDIKYSFSNSDTYFNINASVYEDLDKKNSSDTYEYILPNINYEKSFLTEKYGKINFKSNALYSHYSTNAHKTFLTNDIIWNPFNTITKNGFVNSIEGMLRNTNYETKKTTGEFKDQGTVNELSSVLSYKSSLPMKKSDLNYSKFFSPNFMLRYAPGHMRNLGSKDIILNYTNLYSLNKTSEIEDGLSAVLGVDYKISEKKDGIDNEKLLVSFGQVFNYEKNKDMPSKSSLDQKMSDIVGEVKYNFSEIGTIDYKFTLDHNLNDLNYNDVSSVLNFGKVQFNLDYLEKQNHIGNEHYVSSGVTLNFDAQNKLSFSTKKNFKTDSTELYNLSYQYGIDCLTAGIAYRREFYQDIDDLEPKNTLMFTISFIPFAKVKSPAIKP